jgi:hypothetical protein
MADGTITMTGIAEPDAPDTNLVEIYKENGTSKIWAKFATGSPVELTAGGSAVTLTPGSDSANVIQPSGDYIALSLKANASQTKSLLVIEDSAGVDLLTVSAKGKLIVLDSAVTAPLSITEQSTAPSSPAAEDVYLDDGTNTASGDPGFRRYTGAGWEDVGGGGGTGVTLTPSSDTDNVIQPSNDSIALSVKANASQTKNLFVVEDSAGTDLLTVSSKGKLVVLNSAVTAPLSMTEQSAAPSSPVTGDIYLDDGSNTANGLPAFRRYTGAAWEDINVVPFVSARVYHNTNQSLTNGAFTSLAFNSERWDNATLHDTVTNNTRITIAETGYYLCGGMVRFASNNTGARFLGLYVNGATIVSGVNIAAAQNTTTNIETTALLYLSASDYVELAAVQSSGGALNIEYAAEFSPEFWCYKVYKG